MNKINRVLLVMITIITISCNQRNRQETVVETDTAYVTIPEGIDDVVRARVIDNRGRVLNMTYYNREGRAEMELNGEMIELREDSMASGIGFRNDDYVFREWQGDITLIKNGEIVFDTRREIVNGITDNQGRSLEIAFNNLNGSATLMYEGETIRLSEDTMTSGNRYSNARYIYEDSNGMVKLKKDGQTVFTATKQDSI